MTTPIVPMRFMASPFDGIARPFQLRNASGMRLTRLRVFMLMRSDKSTLVTHVPVPLTFRCLKVTRGAPRSPYSGLSTSEIALTGSPTWHKNVERNECAAIIVSTSGVVVLFRALLAFGIGLATEASLANSGIPVRS
jgi:hypothetical protein